MSANIIFVINSGEIVEQGTHAELMEEGNAYARLYAVQFAEQAEEKVSAGTVP